MIEMVSPKPRVWMSPTRARLSWIIAFVATVVPCAKSEI